MRAKMKEIVAKIEITKGPTLEHPLSLALKDKNNNCIGGSYHKSITDLIKAICILHESNDLPWETNQ
jgi:hypothetical protein